MIDRRIFPVILGRLLEAMRSGDGEAQRGPLHAIVEMAASGSTAVRLDGPRLTVEGALVEPLSPPVETLIDRMRAHGLAAIHAAYGASAVEFMHLARALAETPDEAKDFGARLRDAAVTSITVVSEPEAQTQRSHGRVRVTEAVGTPVPREGTSRSTVERAETTASGIRAATGGLAAQVLAVVNDPGSPQLMAHVEAVRNGVAQALKNQQVGPALDALVTLVRHEADTPIADVRRAISVIFRYLLAPEYIRILASSLMDELYAEDVVTVVRRAGRNGTKVVLDLLVEAPTYAERRAYLAALRQMEEGADVVAGLLSHRQWFVVRNAADLVGELRVEEAVSALGEVVSHGDARVRRSVGIALGKIATPSTVRFLSRVLKDPDASVRLAVAQQIGGRGLGTLAMPLVNAAAEEQDPEVQSEYYRALGRIGTPEAVRVLVKLAEPGGRLLGRRPSAPRLAAVEGLGLAGGKLAEDALKELSDDRSGDVREAARRELGRLSEA